MRSVRARDILLFFGALFLIGLAGAAYHLVVGTANEAARRTVFENSKSYRDGMIQELQNMQIEYIQASPEHQKALASIIKHRAAGIDLNDLPRDLSSFIRGL